MPALNWFDYVIIVVVGLSVITGLFRGFVKELVALCIWVAAIWLGVLYAPTVEPIFQPYIHDHSARLAIAFILILLGTLILGGICNAFLHFILRRTGLSGTDRLLGMLFGFVRGVFITALFILLLQMSTLPYQSYLQSSYLYPTMQPLVQWLHQIMPNWLQHMSSKPAQHEKAELKPDL